MTLELWNQKHRPPTADQYVWTDPNLKIRFENWIKHPEQVQHMIFAGLPGIGKTTLAEMLAQGMGLEKNLDYVMFRVGMKPMSELLADIVEFCESGFSTLKMIILDEGDRLTSQAQSDLRPICDRYQNRCRFIITCNDAGKLKNFVGSRTILVEFKQLDEEQYFERLVEIAATEGIDLDDEETLTVLSLIKNRAYPDLRQAINLMQHAHVNGKLIEPGKAVVEKEWHATLLGHVEKLNIADLRESLQGFRRDELATAYRVLVDNTDVFSDNEDEAVVMIAEAMHRHSSAEYPDITLLALMCKLHGLFWKKK